MKSDRESYIIYDLNCMTFWKRQNQRDNKQSVVAKRLKVVGVEQMKYRKFF